MADGRMVEWVGRSCVGGGVGRVSPLGTQLLYPSMNKGSHMFAFVFDCVGREFAALLCMSYRIQAAGPTTNDTAMANDSLRQATQGAKLLADSNKSNNCTCNSGALNGCCSHPKADELILELRMESQT